MCYSTSSLNSQGFELDAEDVHAGRERVCCSAYIPHPAAADNCPSFSQCLVYCTTSCTRSDVEHQAQRGSRQVHLVSNCRCGRRMKIQSPSAKSLVRYVQGSQQPSDNSHSAHRGIFKHEVQALTGRADLERAVPADSTRHTGGTQHDAHAEHSRHSGSR